MLLRESLPRSKPAAFCVGDNSGQREYTAPHHPHPTCRKAIWPSRWFFHSHYNTPHHPHEVSSKMSDRLLDFFLILTESHGKLIFKCCNKYRSAHDLALTHPPDELFVNSSDEFSVIYFFLSLRSEFIKIELHFFSQLYS